MVICRSDNPLGLRTNSDFVSELAQWYTSTTAAWTQCQVHRIMWCVDYCQTESETVSTSSRLYLSTENLFPFSLKLHLHLRLVLTCIKDLNIMTKWCINNHC